MKKDGKQERKGTGRTSNIEEEGVEREAGRDDAQQAETEGGVRGVTAFRGVHR